MSKKRGTMKFHSLTFIAALMVFHTVEAKTPFECHKVAKEACKSKPGKERIECLKTEIAKDPECQKIMDKGRQMMGPGGADHPCKVDREKCQESGGGHAAVMKCLYEKRAELSDSCKKHMEEKIATMPCFEDRIKFCKDVKPGGGAMHDCLKKNEAELSAACKEKVAKGKKENFDKDM